MTRKSTNTGKELERYVADAYRKMGARKVEHNVEIGGHQIDVYVELETADRSLHRIAVEAKDYARPVGVGIVGDFSNIVAHLHRERLIDKGVIVSTSGFSPQARNAAKTSDIRLLERLDLEAMITEVKEVEETSSTVPPVPQLPEPEISSDIPEIIPIPAGPFWMGSDLDDIEAHDNEKPRRKLELPEYRIGRYPVTNAQYACFVHATKRNPPEHWDGENVPTGLEDHPVVNVNHADAEAYCRWLSKATKKHYRLPTEEEWEKAARGDSSETRRYPWGDDRQNNVCNTEEMERKGTTSVHEFEQDNQSPFGVVDMAGNVWEWTASWYVRYEGSPYESMRLGKTYRVVRGSSWKHSNWCARISCRGRYKPDTQRNYLGFRVASG